MYCQGLPPSPSPLPACLAPDRPSVGIVGAWISGGGRRGLAFYGKQANWRDDDRTAEDRVMG